MYFVPLCNSLSAVYGAGFSAWGEEGTLLLLVIQPLHEHRGIAEEGTRSALWQSAPWTIWLVQAWQVFQWAKHRKQFGNIYMKHILQLLTGATWDLMDLLLALACYMQSAVSPLQHFCTHPWDPSPLDLCAGGNNLSSPLSSQSKLMSLVVAATIIRLNFGFGSGGVIQETHVCSLTGTDWCHLVCQSYKPGAAAPLAFFTGRDVSLFSVVHTYILEITGSPSPGSLLHFCRH